MANPYSGGLPLQQGERDKITYSNALGNNSMPAQRWLIALQGRRLSLLENLAQPGISERASDELRGAIGEIEQQIAAVQRGA